MAGEAATRGTAALVEALERIRREAESLGSVAQRGIERHAFDPYRQFRTKIEEHEALIAVLRARLGGGDAESATAAAATREERLRYELQVSSALRFFYALSASTVLPIGARETFIGELKALTIAKQRLDSPEHAPFLSDGVLDDLDTARMILEEIASKAPRLLEFDGG